VRSQPVIIDTDAGVDDALAIIFAIRSPELSVKAITTVAGNVEVEQCTRNVYQILSWLQPPVWPLLARGARKPLKRPLITAPEVHGRDGLGNLFLPPQRIRTPRAGPVLLQFARAFQKRLTIIALGPLTNIARMIRAHPHTARRIGRIISMGGAFRVPGNTGPVAEFNYYVDPEAAHIVLNSGIAVTVVPLDVTEQLVLMRKEVVYRSGRRASRLAQMIERFTKSYMLYHKRTEGFNGGYLHDPLVAAIAIDPTLVRTKKVHVEVETVGELTKGMTIADFRRPRRRGENLVDVAVAVERERFFRLFHERLWE
jgi:inosine-uridine nucleoside N-ribohydrolase